MALFLGCLQYTLEEGPRWGWLEDSTIRASAWISGVAGIGFVWRTLTARNPVVDLTAFRSRNFALGCFFSFVTGIGIFATIYLTPLFLGRVRGFSALQIGLAVFSTGIFQVMAIPVYAVLARRVDLRWLMMFGLSLFGISMYFFSPITHDWGWRELLFPQALRGFAQQFAVAPVVTLTLGGLARANLKLASGLFNLMRNLGGAIGIAVCGTILNDRTNLHFHRLAEHLNATNTAMASMLNRVSAHAAPVLGDARRAHAAGLKRLWAMTYREAQVMTYADIFFMMMICFVVATAMVPLMRRVGPPKAPSSDAH
jgi:DHA2 family multidrug resistance protein